MSNFKNTIMVYSDYVCPFCLLAEHVIAQAIGKEDITISWQAFELRPYPVPTLRPEDEYLPAIWKKSVYPLAEKLGVFIKLPTISPQPRTKKAFKLLLLAKDRRVEQEYSMEVFKAFFQQNLDIGEEKVLLTIAKKVGLNVFEAQQAFTSEDYQKRHLEALRHAHEDMNITTVPTIVVGKKIFRGTPSIESLREAIVEMKK